MFTAIQIKYYFSPLMRVLKWPSVFHSWMLSGEWLKSDNKNARFFFFFSIRKNKKGASLCFVRFVTRFLVPRAKRAAETVPGWRASVSDAPPDSCKKKSFSQTSSSTPRSFLHIQREFHPTRPFYARSALKCCVQTWRNEDIGKRPYASPRLRPFCVTPPRAGPCMCHV